ncbi:TonB-dependent receptor plug domain-containing protein [Thiomicrorhabdus indica]|uniref:TonB-dependent receptor plug domain-containing protein n=1 Tax=Thiomicrorhabdus indica TaxID=2267253 RepID=UPI00102D8054|nr:TonB-dependent receptor [Thiomicrorhabdus indica]
MRLTPVAACVVSLFSSQLFAASSSTSLETVTITSASKTEQTIEASNVSVEVIDEAEIKATGASTLSEILRHSDAVFMNPDGSNLSIRGVGAKGVLLLIDGRRVATEFTKNFDGGRIPLASIERIEVVKGPMAALYGSDALGGVINIITKTSQDGVESSISLSGGAAGSQAQQMQLEADIRGKHGKTGYSAWFSAQNREDYTEQEMANIAVMQAGAAKKPSQLPDSGSFAKLKSDLADAYAVDTTYRAATEVVNVGTNITHQVNDDLELSARFSAMLEEQDRISIANLYESNYRASGNTIKTRNIPVIQQLENERFEFGVGAKYQVSDKLSFDWKSDISYYKKQDEITTLLWRELGYSSQSDSAGLTGDGKVTIQQHSLNSLWKPNEVHQILVGLESFEDKRDAVFFDSSGRMTTKILENDSIFAQYQWQVTEPLSIISGVRYDDTSSGGDDVTGNLGMVYQFNEMANLRARYAQGFRAPDSQEMFINRFNPQGKRFVGSDVVDVSINKQAFELESETSENYELGLSGRNKHWSYDLSVYRTNIENNILRLTTADYLSFRNAKDVTMKGVDASLGLNVNNDLTLEFAVNLIDSEDKETGNSLEFTPEKIARITASYQVTPQLNTRVDMQYVDDQIYSEVANGQTRYLTVKAYQLVNVHFDYLPKSYQNLELFGGIRNLFDEEIDTELGSDPGTYVHAGVRVYF